jgi:hypothetical protein
LRAHNNNKKHRPGLELRTSQQKAMAVSIVP